MPKAVIAIEGSRSPHRVGWAPAEGSLAAVANRPLVAHALDAVRRAGATEVVIAAAERTLPAVVEAFDDELDDVRWLAMPGAPSVADAVHAAAPHLRGERFLVHAGDGMLLRDRGVLAAALQDASADATVFFPAGRPVDAAPVGTGVLGGVNVFSDAVLDAVAATDPGDDGRRSIFAAVDRLAETGGRVQAAVLADWWRYEPDAARLLHANRIVLDDLEADGSCQQCENVRLEGRVRVHPTAVVRDAVIRGPGVIGAHAHVTDAYVGPYTTVGDGATIENSEIESSIVLPRARIRHVGVRVEDSIVGAGATVGRDFAMPKSLRLLVGRDARVTLA